MTNSVLPARYVEEARVGPRLVLAVDRLSGRPVAVKLAEGPGPFAAAELARELEILAACEHPNIPKALDFGTATDDRAFLVMERAQGRRPRGPLAFDELRVLAEGLCEALALLHSRGLLHRDLKPANVHFDPASGRVMLLDLGLAEEEGAASEVRGTVGYMAPEVLGNGSIDRRADLYSLGALLYEVATGRRPFEGSDAQVLLRQREGRFDPANRRRTDLPAGLAALIGALLDPNPSRRPADARDVRDRLLAALGADAESAGPAVLAPAFVGRERELAQLDDAAGLAGERGVRLAVCGPAGSGRTRLLSELRVRLFARGALVVQQPLRDGDDHPLARLAEQLAAALGTPAPPADAHPLASCRAAIEAAQSSLPVQGRTGPLVLLLDDLDRADGGVLQDVEALWTGAEGPLLLVTTHDPQRLRWPPRGGARIDLPPLGRAERARLAGTALLGRPPEALVELLEERGLAQPRALVDALRGLLDAGLLQRVADRWTLTADAEDSPVVSDEQAPTLGSEAAALGVLLEALDCEVPLAELGEMAGVEARRVQAAARELSACDLARVEGGRAAPTSRLQRVAGELFEESARRAAHDRLLELHVRLSPESSQALRLTKADGAEAFRLRHEARASDAEKAVDACARLAEEQLRRGTASAALRLARLGLDRQGEAAPSPEGAAARAQARLHAAEAEALTRCGRLEEALAAAESRSDAARRSGCAATRVEALRALGSIALKAGSPRRAEKALDAALATRGEDGGELSSRVRARLLLERAAVDRRCGEHAAAEERLAEAGYLLCGSNDVEGEARVLVARARVSIDRGELAAARSLLRVAVRRFQELDQPLATARALRDLGWCESLSGSARRAQRTLRTALNLVEKHGDQELLAGLHVALGAVASTAGSPAEAVAHYRRGLTAYQRSGDVPGQLAAMNNLGWQLFVGGEVAGAAAAFREVLELRERTGVPSRGEAMTRNNLGLALCAGADYAEALECCRRAHESAVAAGDARVESEAAWGLGRIYSALGATEDGLSWQSRALAAAESGDNPLGRCYALSEMGPLLVREARLEDAASTLQDAVRTAQDCGERSMEALCRARLGAVEAARGRLGDGVRLLREGLSIAISCGDRLVQLEAERHLGALFCELGDFASGLPLLDESLSGCRQAGFLHELPAAHQALAAAHLRRSLRLKTSTGAVVDRREIEVAREHLERGLDLTLTTGRMADRVQLRVLSTAARLVEGDTSVVSRELEEARRLAEETGDRLASVRSRLLEAEARFTDREFGEALRHAREACTQFERIGSAEDAWRAHALLGRIHGAWGMRERETEETARAAEILRRLRETIDDEPLLRSFTADVERRAAEQPAGAGAGAGPRRRRVVPAAIDSERFAGQVDVEDLVEELLQARRRVEEGEQRGRRRKAHLRRAVASGRLLAGVARLLSHGPVDGEALQRLLALVARTLGGERAFLLASEAGGPRVRGGADAEGRAVELPDFALSAGVVQRVLESGRPTLSSDARRDGRFAEMESVRALDLRSIACVPVLQQGRVLGALYLDDTLTAGSFRRRDLRLLASVADLLAASGLLGREAVPEHEAVPEERLR